MRDASHRREWRYHVDFYTRCNAPNAPVQVCRKMVLHMQNARIDLFKSVHGAATHHTHFGVFLYQTYENANSAVVQVARHEKTLPILSFVKAWSKKIIILDCL